MSSSPEVSPRLESIDFLRGLAALAVLACHALDFRHAEGWLQWVGKTAEHGHLGVALFFVISGFCIHLKWTRQYAQTKRNSIDFLEFWKRRLRRLYPPYFVMLCVSMALIVGAYFLGRNVPLVTRYPEPRLQWMIYDFLAHATMLHGLHPLLDKMGGNPPFWTLAREEYFYLLYFLLIPLRVRTGSFRTLLVVFILGLTFPLMFRPLLSADSEWWRVILPSAVVLWFQWCLGMLAVEAHYGLVRLPAFTRWWALIPVWMLTAKAAEEVYKPLAPMLWGVAFFTLLNACVERERAGGWWRFGWVRWMTGVGVFSYSLYLVHYPALAVLRQATRPLVRGQSSGVELVAALAMGAVAFAVARIYFQLVERRFLNTSPDAPGVGRSRVTPVPGAAP
jgi:peptidoglycan/LPS O-acetylase OafA/YrhL